MSSPHWRRPREDGTKLQNIRSVAGFERRLNDMSCAGCHQTRGIGGFHFPGVDWMAAKPSNSTVVPASPHFFGDQVRRRDILAAFADGKAPDFSRGFASRPQLRGSTELAGTEYENGWGAHCYAQQAKASENDRSFRVLDLRRGARLPDGKSGDADGHVLCQDAVGAWVFRRHCEPSGSRERAPDDRLREAIQNASEEPRSGLLRRYAPRNDV